MGVEHEQFATVARFYDQIMTHVDYDRWFLLATSIGQMLPPHFVHVDAACGTGKLLRKLRQAHWNSYGFDRSLAMLNNGEGLPLGSKTIVADLRALPLRENVDYITCLFDSLNFLLSIEEVHTCLNQIQQALSPAGLVYFDVVTEQMVTEFFEDQEWTERNGGFTTTWSSKYCRKSRIAETTIRVNTGFESVLNERVYTQKEIESAVRSAGLTLLGAYDAETWRKPTRKTLRIDFVAAKQDTSELRAEMDRVASFVRKLLRQ